MTKPNIKIHNVETNEEIEREMTDEEFSAYQATELELANAKTETEAKIAARQAILNRLGLTEEEARLLLG